MEHKLILEKGNDNFFFGLCVVCGFFGLDGCVFFFPARGELQSLITYESFCFLLLAVCA